MIDTLVNQCPHSELIEMYKKRIRKEYTQEQLTDAVVDWSYANCLSGYEKKADPFIPDTLDTFNRLNVNERKNLSPEYAQKVEKIKKGYEYARSSLRSEAIANKCFLIEMIRSFLRRNKLEEMSKVEDILSKYEDYGTTDEAEYANTKIEIAKKMFKGEVRQYKED